MRIFKVIYKFRMGAVRYMHELAPAGADPLPQVSRAANFNYVS